MKSTESAAALSSTGEVGRVRSRYLPHIPPCPSPGLEPIDKSWLSVYLISLAQKFHMIFFHLRFHLHQRIIVDTIELESDSTIPSSTVKTAAKTYRTAVPSHSTPLAQMALRCDLENRLFRPMFSRPKREGPLCAMSKMLVRS